MTAAVFGSPPADGEPWYEFRLAAENPANIAAVGGMKIEAHGGLDELLAAEVVVVPGWVDPTMQPSRRLVEAIAAAYERGAALLSICSGAFVLAEAGILNGKQVTTHWSRVDLFARRYPQVRLVPDALYVDEGQVLTSAGGAAGLDLLLHYVRRQHGARTANLIARRLIVPPHRQGGQVQGAATPVAPVCTDRLAAVIDWMSENYGEPLSVSELAARALMSERTFTRRFRQVTGSAAIEWLIGLRIKHAKALLQESDLHIDTIAQRTGFTDADALRHHFQSSQGRSPRTYRAQRKSAPTSGR